MAARYAKLTIRASWSWVAFTRGNQTTEVRFRLGGQWHTYRRGANTNNNEFVVPDPNSVTPPESFVLEGVKNLLALVRATINRQGLFYTVSAPRYVGDDTSHVGQGSGFNQELNPWPIIEFDIEATIYNPSHDLDFADYGTAASGFAGWQVVSKLPTIKPLLLSVTTVDAGIFGSATGSATVAALGNGAPATYTYGWADGAVGDSRANLVAGTYYCTVTDALGEQARATVVIKSDPPLVVQVLSSPTRVELVPSGGLAPYTYLWADGTTTAIRTGLAPGTYTCTVTDARGATKLVSVTISLASRYWFSGNPVTLAVVATDPDTTSFVCEVWVERVYGSGTFVLAGQALEQPAVAGATLFEVQELLEPYVLPVVPARRPVVQRADGAFCRFFLKHHEVGPGGPGAATSVDTNYLLHGGLGFDEAARGVWFASYQQRFTPFLNWEPTRKKVLPDQPEYLYFQALTNLPAGFSLRFRLIFADGTTQAVPAVAGPPALANEVFCLLVGPQLVGIENFEQLAGQLVAHYTAQVFDPATDQPLSELRTFVLDRRPCPVRRYFLYANSLGGWNTLVCRGRASQELSTKTSVSENARAAGYDPLRGDYTTNRRTGVKTLKCYAGARSAAQLLADQDFLLSERVLLLSGGRYLAGQVKDVKVTVLDEDETRRLLQFDFELPRERYHTPALN